MAGYYEALQKLLPKKILEKLLIPYVMQDENSKRNTGRHSLQPRLGNQLKSMKKGNMTDLPILDIDQNMRSDLSKKFIKLFSIAEERTPELIWNNTMRDELQDCLQV